MHDLRPAILLSDTLNTVQVIATMIIRLFRCNFSLSFVKCSYRLFKVPRLVRRIAFLCLLPECRWIWYRVAFEGWQVPVRGALVRVRYLVCTNSLVAHGNTRLPDRVLGHVSKQSVSIVGRIPFNLFAKVLLCLHVYDDTHLHLVFIVVASQRTARWTITRGKFLSRDQIWKHLFLYF